jgi:hypothetical protein
MYFYKRKMNSPVPSDRSHIRFVDPYQGKIGGEVGAAKGDSASPYVLLTLVVVWYGCSVVTITTSKELMLISQLPYLLCFCQFLFASALSYVYLAWSKRLKAIQAETRSAVIKICVSYTLGFVLTNIAFSIGMPVGSS